MPAGCYILVLLRGMTPLPEGATVALRLRQEGSEIETETETEGCGTEGSGAETLRFETGAGRVQEQYIFVQYIFVLLRGMTPLPTGAAVSLQ